MDEPPEVRGFRILKARLAKEQARKAALSDEEWFAECSPAVRAEIEAVISDARQLLEEPNTRPAVLRLFRTLATDPRAQDELRAAIGDGLRGGGMMPS